MTPEMKLSGANDNFNDIVSKLAQLGNHREVRGMVVAAMILANAEPDCPDMVKDALILTFSAALDAELREITKQAKVQLSMMGIDSERVKQALMNKMAEQQVFNGGESSGKPN